MNETLQSIFMPMLRQMGADIAHFDESKCFATFDNEVYEGSFYAVKADDYCLITRFDVRVLAPAVLHEHHVESLCIASCSEDCFKGLRHDRSHLMPEKNIAVYANHDETVERALPEGGVYKLITIFFLPEYFLQDSVAAIGDYRQISESVTDLDGGMLGLYLRGLFDELDMDRAVKPSGSLYYRSKAMQALVYLHDLTGEMNRLRRAGIDGEDFRLVRNVIEAIEEDLARTPSIYELTQRLYVGHTHLCETFKRTTGFTIGQYSLKRRMEFSQVLLRDPEIPIKEVARRVGYGSTESFSSSFKRATGTSPRAYRMAMLM